MRLHVLSVAYEFEGKQDCLYPVLLQSEKELVLADCGYGGFLPKLEAAANVHGLSLSGLTGIVITHHDIDHVGGLHELKTRYPSIKVYSSELDKPYIEGVKPSLRLQQAEALFDALPDEYKPGAVAFQKLLKTVKPVRIDDVLPSDGALPFLPGVKVITTPGHMPGHISLYVEEGQTLIAADALVIENGELEIANPQFTLDLKAALQSVKKLSRLTPRQIICYHGGSLRENTAQRFKNLLIKYGNK